MLFGCISATKTPEVNNLLCSGQWIDSTVVKKMKINDYSDRHGEYFRLENCPDKAFGIDFSESGLFTDNYKNLLNQMQLNSNRGTPPLKMTVSGVLTSREEKGIRRNYLKVLKIESYAIDKK